LWGWSAPRTWASSCPRPPTEGRHGRVRACVGGWCFVRVGVWCSVGSCGVDQPATHGPHRAQDLRRKVGRGGFWCSRGWMCGVLVGVCGVFCWVLCGLCVGLIFGTMRCSALRTHTHTRTHAHTHTHTHTLTHAHTPHRVLFFLPWEGCTLAGTTDAASKITMDPAPTAQEVQFIMQVCVGVCVCVCVCVCVGLFVCVDHEPLRA
jgi:hypothetical protein